MSGSAGSERPRPVVLSDAERRRLRQIEHALEQDAEFVRDLQRATALLAAGPVAPLLRAAGTAASCVAAVVAVLLLSAGLVAGALAAGGLALIVGSCCAPRTAARSRGWWRRTAVRRPQEDTGGPGPG